MDKNDELWFLAKNQPSNHKILWSENFLDTRYCGQKVDKMCILSENENIDILHKILEMREEWRHA